MATNYGPKTVSDSLLLYYDVDNTKSYVGPPYMNVAIDLRNYVILRVDCSKFSSAEISCPIPEASVYLLRTNNVWANTLIRDSWDYGNTDIIRGTVGGGNYRYSMYVKPHPSNTATMYFSLDINDKNYVEVTLAPGSDWQLIQTTDINAFNLNYQFFDMYMTPVDLSQGVYVNGLMIARNVWPTWDLSANLRPLNYYPPFIPEKYSTSHTSLLNIGGNSSINMRLIPVCPSTNKPWFFQSDVSMDQIYPPSEYGGITIPGFGYYKTSSTEECWFKTYDTSIRAGIIGYLGGTGAATWGLQPGGGIYLYTDAIAASLLSDIYGYYVVSSSYGVIQKNRWYHAVMTKDCCLGIIKLYLNSNKIGQSSFDVSGYGYWSAFGEYMAGNYYGVGYFNTANAGGLNRYFKGEIPVAKHYQRVLTDAEITQNFNSMRGRFGL